VDQEDIVEYISHTFGGLDVMRPTEGPGAGDTFFIYDPEGNLEPRQQLPFATIVTKNYGDFDNASRLDRPGVYRLNIGVGRDTFRSLFRTVPAGGYDYAALDQLMPHPVYASQSWVSVLNPSRATFERLKSVLAEAYSLAVTRLTNRAARRDPRPAEH
jgi:Family of unknown function (DUF6194)